MLASAGEGVKLWAIATKEDGGVDRLIGPPLEPAAAIVAVGFTPDGACLLAACSDGTVMTWDIATGQKLS